MSNMVMEIPAGAFKVHTTNNRGHTPAEIAQFCVDRMMSVSDTAPPEIRDQARAFQQELLRIAEHYITMGIEQDRVTVGQKLREAGFADLADQIRRL